MLLIWFVILGVYDVDYLYLDRCLWCCYFVVGVC